MISYQSSIGIEVREGSMILVHLKKTLRKIKVQNSLIIPFSSRMSPEEESEVVDSLKRFLHQNSAAHTRIVIGIPRNSVLLKSIEIPSFKKDDIPQILEYEIEKHLPFSPEDAYYDFEIIEKAGENIYRIFLAALKKETVDSLNDLFERVYPRTKIFDLTSFGILNALGFSNGYPEDKIDAIIFLGFNDVELYIVQNGLLRYSRFFPINDEGSFLEGLYRELEIGMSGIDTKGKVKKIHRVILSGPGALRNGLIESIKENISSDAKLDDLFNKIIMRPMEAQERCSLIPSIGLALRGLGEGRIKINFLPHEREIGRKKKRLASIILIVTNIFLGLAIIVGHSLKDSIETRNIEKKIEALKPDANAVEKIQREIKRFEEKKMILDKIKENDLSKLDTIAELTRIVPQDAWLVSLDYTETLEQKGTRTINGNIKRELVISGFATTASRLIPLLEDSPIFENVEFIGPITFGSEGKERFRIKTLLENKSKR